MAVAGRSCFLIIVLTLPRCAPYATDAHAQSSIPAAEQSPPDIDADVRRGSATAKAGFRNEDQVRDKFNNWKTDRDAQAWLMAMNHSLPDIVEVQVEKPHGQKADVVVAITSKSGRKVTEGISIKLVSGASGFNQIDKRWLKSYAALWKMPSRAVAAMELYVGETAPIGPSRRPDRMYLDELPDDLREAVVEFFTGNKRRIVEDLFTGDGPDSAQWFMVTQKAESSQRWTIRSLNEVIKFYAEGDVVLTRAGNLKIGRVSMQRKGGDNGRDTARMLQFKINPVLLLDAP